MLLLHQLCLLTIAVVTSTAAPSSTPLTTRSTCMCDTEAHQIGWLWTQLIGNYSLALAASSLATNYTDYSASALTLNNVCPQAPVASPPLLDPVFTNRTQFEGGQGMQAPIASKMLKVWHSCSTVTMRYEMTNCGGGSMPVVGVIAIETVPVSTFVPRHQHYSPKIHADLEGS